MHARTRCAVLVLSGLLVVAACNDDDDGDGAAIASSDTAGAAAVAEAVETTAPSVDGTERPVDTFGPPVTTIAPSGAVLFGGDDFYAVPEPLPAGEPGTLLRYEPIEVFGGWSNFGDSPGEFGLQTLGTVSGEIVIWRDPVAVRTERVDRPVPDDAVGRSSHELASWLAEHPQLEASDPAAVSVGGLDGFEVEIAVAPTSTNTPAMCPSGEVCVDLFAPPHLGFAWRLVTRGDRARLILLATADGAGTVLIALDPYDHLGTDVEAFDTLARPLLDSIDFTAGEPEPVAGDCVNGFGSCRGSLEPGVVQVSRVRTLVQLHGWPTPSGWASSVADDVPVRVDPGRTDRRHRHRPGAVDRGAGRWPPDPQRRPRHDRHRR